MTKAVTDKTEYFQFKHFKLRNSHAALKVNTDGVLLAAWIKMQEGISCLDIGTGSGVIALILNERYPMNHFTTIEIDPESYKEALYNFNLNLKPIDCHLSDFTTYKPQKTFDHFVSNPPYFESSTLPDGSNKLVSKHQNTLSMKSLWDGVASLSHENSKFSVIIPFIKHESFNDYAQEKGFRLLRQTFVHGKKGGKVVRVLKEYGKGFQSEALDEFIHIRDIENGGFGPAYKDLSKDLYLNF